MSLSFLEESAFQYWAQLDCPTSLALTILARAGDWTAVLTFKVVPENFIDPHQYARANAAVCYLKKNPHVSGSSDSQRKEACLASWRVGESSCYQANERIAPYLMHPLEDSMPAKFLRRARKILLSWLGPCPPDVRSGSPSESDRIRLGYGVPPSLVEMARHGPGTTFSSSVANPTAADKFDETVSMTRGASFYLWNLADTLWIRAILDRAARMSVSPLDCINVSRGNRFTTVPKTALTDRGIAVECSLNIYFQLAIGSAIKRSLRKRVGFDLEEAPDWHREVARQSSIDGRFATIDLSNASDSLCKNLVRVLLQGTDWLDRMEDLRSTHTFFAGKWHLLEKFSSMGNGYTFELETCVFACLIAAVLELHGDSAVLGHDFSVFGDDLIVPTEHAESVVAALAWAGFKVNKEKTFLRGSFRESCGGDYFLGYPVRGFYLKQDLCYGTQAVFTLHNGARLNLENCGVYSPWFLDWVRERYLPSALRRIGGSTRLGDSVLHGLPATFRWRSGVRWVRAVRWYEPKLLKWKFWSDLVRLACRLTGAGDTLGINSRGHRPAVEMVWVSDS